MKNLIEQLELIFYILMCWIIAYIFTWWDSNFYKFFFSALFWVIISLLVQIKNNTK